MDHSLFLPVTTLEVAEVISAATVAAVVVTEHPLATDGLAVQLHFATVEQGHAAARALRDAGYGVAFAKSDATVTRPTIVEGHESRRGFAIDSAGRDL